VCKCVFVFELFESFVGHSPTVSVVTLADQGRVERREL
jgi:hypothetical protein